MDMIQVSEGCGNIYFKTPREAAKFLSASSKRVQNCCWLNSDFNTQEFSYSGFKLKKRGEHECSGCVCKWVDISEEEAKLRNAIAGWDGAERSADQVWDH